MGGIIIEQAAYMKSKGVEMNEAASTHIVTKYSMWGKSIEYREHRKDTQRHKKGNQKAQAWKQHDALVHIASRLNSPAISLTRIYIRPLGLVSHLLNFLYLLGRCRLTPVMSVWMSTSTSKGEWTKRADARSMSMLPPLPSTAP